MRKWPYILLPVLAALILVFQVQLDQAKQSRPELRRGIFTPPRPEIFKVVMMGYHLVAADIYWLGAIQYFSDCVDEKVPPDDLFPMTNFITDLDPRFCTPYYFSGMNMALNDSDPNQAAALLEKGRGPCPEKWKIPFTQGYIYYFLLHDPERAAAALEAANRIKPNRSFALLAARMRAEAGSPELGIQFLKQMISNTDDENMRQNFEQRILELLALIAERDLNRAVEIYQQQTGALPQSLDDLVTAKIIRGVPAHPLANHRFIYDPATGQVKSDPPVVERVFINTQ